MPDDQPIEHGLVSRSIEQAQKKIEGLHFDSRKQVLEYDDIMNRQREVIYKKRRAWIDPAANLREEIMGIVKAEIANVVEAYYADPEAEPKDLVEKLNAIFPVSPEAAAKMAEFSAQAGDEIFATVDFAQKLADACTCKKSSSPQSRQRRCSSLQT